MNELAREPERSMKLRFRCFDRQHSNMMYCAPDAMHRAVRSCCRRLSEPCRFATDPAYDALLSRCRGVKLVNIAVRICTRILEESANGFYYKFYK